jgi:hypothetical protein
MADLKFPRTRKPTVTKVAETVGIMEAYKEQKKLRDEAVEAIKNYVVQLDSVNRMRLRKAEFVVVKTKSGKSLVIKTEDIGGDFQESDLSDHKVLCRLQVTKESVKAHRVKAHNRWAIRSAKGPNKASKKKG